MKPSQLDDFAYTRQFFTITRQGHVRTTQSFGTPTLVWHVAFWPRKQFDPQNNQEKSQAVDNDETNRSEFNRRRAEIASRLDQLLTRLQEHGRAGSRPAECFGLPEPPADVDHDAAIGHQLKVFPRESLSFTLWWSDNGSSIRNRMGGRPTGEDIRVRVQADLHSDFASLAFFIDAAKPWDAEGARASKDAVGGRRRRILKAVEDVRDVCGQRINKPLVDVQLLPEPDGKEFSKDAQQLKGAADLLYENIWLELCKDFSFDLTDIVGSRGVEASEQHSLVFANFRGLVMSTPANGVQSDSKGAIDIAEAARGLVRFSRPDDTVDVNFDNANPIVKAYWPFVRRLRADADYRDWIACGIFDWRALYITAVGAQSEFDELDEGRGYESDVPAGSLPERKLRSAMAGEVNWDAEPFARAPTTKPDGDRPAPFRYLILTAGEPHRRQVGRMVDRVNSLGTLRLFALRNWSVLRDADFHVRMYGQRLDSILAAWKEAASQISIKYNERHDELVHSELAAEFGGVVAEAQNALNTAEREEFMLALSRPQSDNAYRKTLQDIIDFSLKELKSSRHPGGRRSRSLVKSLRSGKSDIEKVLIRLRDDAQEMLAESRRMKSEKDEELARNNQNAEFELIKIAAALDSLGANAVGGLPYRLNRSKYYSQLFRAQVPTLRCGQIDTWWSYDQFATRAVEPALKFIENLDHRLAALRQRLADATENVQTSAIVNQTEATRDNTFQLEVIAGELKVLAQSSSDILNEVATVKFWAQLLAIVNTAIAIAIAVFNLPWSKLLKP